jgi:hypothetical protein
MKDSLGNTGRDSVIMQCSSLGSLDEEWMEQFRKSVGAFRVHDQKKQTTKFHREVEGVSAPDFKLVWQSFAVVRDCPDGWAAGGSIPLRPKNIYRDEKAFIRNKYMYKWEQAQDVQREPRIHRMSHCKTLVRVNHDTGTLPWVLTGSHNLSKAAWGKREKSGKFYVANWELSVLFLPYMAKGNIDRYPEALPVFQRWPLEGPSTKSNTLYFPLMHSLTPSQYTFRHNDPTDQPFVQYTEQSDYAKGMLAPPIPPEQIDSRGYALHEVFPKLIAPGVKLFRASSS